MVSASRSSLISDANREVQAADHILCAIYPLTRDPKALIGALSHELHALDKAACALAHAQDPTQAFAELRGTPGAHDAALARDRIAGLLARHDAAHTVFTRGQSRVIADEGFSELAEIDQSMVDNDLRAVKTFVHEANRALMREKVD